MQNLHSNANINANANTNANANGNASIKGADIELYLGFVDSFVATKFLAYLEGHLKGHLKNISLLTSSTNLAKPNIVISDVGFFRENSLMLKQSNVILLLDPAEKDALEKNTTPQNATPQDSFTQDNATQKVLSLNTLNLPLKMEDLIDVIDQVKLSIGRVYSYKSWSLNLNTNVLHKNETKLSLSDKEALILKEFFVNNSENPEQSITKEIFMKSVWNTSGVGVESQSLESYISTLRRKFNDNNIDLVISKNKDGYLLV